MKNKSIIERIIKNEGVDTFEEVRNNDGYLPDITESFLTFYIDNELSDED